MFNSKIQSGGNEEQSPSNNKREKREEITEGSLLDEMKEVENLQQFKKPTQKLI